MSSPKPTSAETALRQTLQERIAELTDAYRQMKQGALWTRVFLLLAGLGAFFFIRFFSGG